MDDKAQKAKRNIWLGLLILLLALGLKYCNEICPAAHARKAPPVKAKFYDFSEQLIDGEVKRPTALYTDVRRNAQFKRLLRLKKSFNRNMLDTARLPVFK